MSASRQTRHSGHWVRAGLVYAARGHAVMRRLDDHANALRLEHIVDGIGDLRRHLFLDLRALRIRPPPGQLGDADHAAVSNIG